MFGWSAATVWWVLAGVLVAVELTTGTAYVLLFAFGMVAAALAAHAGLSLTWQLVAAALLGGGAMLGLYAYRRAHAPEVLPARADRDVNLDIGERVQVASWAGDRTSRVNHRGSVWNARLDPGSPYAQAGIHRVVAVEGNWLVLAPVSASAA